MEFGGLIDAPETSDAGVHLASLRRLLPDYRLLTTVEVGDGKTTAFWHDYRTVASTLANVYPALFSHACRGEASVHSVLSSLLWHVFLLRFTVVAAKEFVALSTLMAGVMLSTEVNVRRCPWEDGAQKLGSSKLYGAVVSTGVGCEYYKFVWENCAPLKVKFFRWLLDQNQIQTKENLVKKNYLGNDACEICGSATESVAHLIVDCAFSSGFWSHIGVDLTKDDVVNLWGVRPPVHLPTTHFNVFLLICCWRMWKHRHDVTFRSLPSCYDRLLAGCHEDVDLWA
jgi:hypothetical protein